jgi:DnaA family protein
MIVKQLPLNLRWAPEYDLSAFFFADPALRELLKNLLQSQTHQALMLVGPANSGKSYLLRALAAERPHSHVSAHPQEPRPEISNANAGGALCVDNLDAAAGNAAAEEWLFHDYNRAVDAGVPWLAAAHEAPANLAIALPDLRSRLMQATLIRLPALNDLETRHRMLRQQAAGMGVALEADVLTYLETHVTRDLAKLSQWLKRLNDYSLSRGRKITAAAVRELLKLDGDITALSSVSAESEI